MKLSPRQRDFLSRLLDLCRKAKAPVHYTNVARALNVRPVTAYEMLRLLEDKGLTYSKTVRPKGRRGRSIVVFSPTEKATTMLAEIAGDPLDEQEWENAKAGILEALERGKESGYQDMLSECLLRIPERKSPLLFAADMVTAILLIFYEMRDTAAAKSVFRHLRRLGPPGWAALYSLAGLSMALSLVERANRRATSLLLSYSQEFREHLDNLTGGDKARLSDFIHDVLRVIGL
jgi:DNA-binding PadR family transcriptional regulator